MPPPLYCCPQRKFQSEDTTLILITPHWPRRLWFSILNDLAVEPPWILPVREDLLYQGPIFCPQVERWNLAAWLLRRKC